jgi:hypothetical protein
VRDRYGLPLSTDSARAAERYVEGIDRLLAWRTGAEDSVEQAIAADERFALAHAAKAAISSLRGRRDQARAMTARAGALALGTTARERGHVAAVQAFVESTPDALARIGEHIAEYGAMHSRSS